MKLIVTKRWDRNGEPEREKFDPSGILVAENIYDHERRKNLQKLADFLLTLKEGGAQESGCTFAMQSWHKITRITETLEISERVPPSQASYECGTSACAVGYAPLAGIKPTPRDTWESFCSREFCDIHSRAMTFLFVGTHEDCPHAAARRINYALKYGIPDVVHLGFAEVEEEVEDCQD